MPNEVEIQKPNLVQLQPEKNFFQQYGEQVVRVGIVGQLLKFSKGDWYVGRDETSVPLGTRLAVNMDAFQIGWIKWSNNRVEEEHMGQAIPAKRTALGDTDEELWEIGADGKPRDPWQFTNRLVLKPPGESYTVDHALTFYTSSHGGIRACGELAAAYGNKLALDDGRNPIIELGFNSYNHPNKAFGKIKVPLLTIVGWEDKDLFTEVVDEPESAKAGKGKRRSAA